MVLLEDRVGLADCHLSWKLHGVGTMQIHMLHAVPCAPLLVGGLWGPPGLPHPQPRGCLH